MARENYDKQLTELRNQMMLLCSMIEEVLQDTIHALVQQDVERAEKIVSGDGKVDEQVKSILQICYTLLLRQQPVASDLRKVSAAMKMITDMERIGDHGTDISELTILMSGYSYPEEISIIEEMSKVTTEMLIDAVDAFAWKNAAKAQNVIDKDDKVDELFLTAKESIAKTIKENGVDAMQELDLLMVAKYFERIGDHATNIAEWVRFSIDGELPADD